MSKYNLITLSLLLNAFINCNAVEYVYPNAAIVDKEGSVRVFVTIQHAPDRLDLYVWNPVDKIATKAVLSTYTPAGFKVLPDKSSFSFVDKAGRIYLKSFNKRSPKFIQLYEPIKDISIIEWNDSQSFYFMGKEASHYALFHSNLNGYIHRIVQSIAMDYIHPSKAGNTLFFIQRNDNKEYSIAQCTYPYIIDDTTLINETEYNRQQLNEIVNSTKNKYPCVATEQIHTLISLGKQPAAFLNMTSEQEGFFIEYPVTINRTDRIIPFTYCRIKKNGNMWVRQQLFTFSLPSHFFLTANDFRLYESLLPLLPRHINNSFYFMHCSNEDDLQTSVYKYDLATGNIKPISQVDAQGPLGVSYFAPVQVNSTVFYGGKLTSETAENHKYPTLWLNSDGFACIDLPSVDDK